MTADKSGCARGRVTLEHAVTGHYELRICQTRGPGLQATGDAIASVCMTREEVDALRAMLASMFPDRVDLDLSAEKPQ